MLVDGFFLQSADAEKCYHASKTSSSDQVTHFLHIILSQREERCVMFTTYKEEANMYCCQECDIWFCLEGNSRVFLYQNKNFKVCNILIPGIVNICRFILGYNCINSYGHLSKLLTFGSLQNWKNVDFLSSKIKRLRITF